VHLAGQAGALAQRRQLLLLGGGGLQLGLGLAQLADGG